MNEKNENNNVVDDYQYSGFNSLRVFVSSDCDKKHKEFPKARRRIKELLKATQIVRDVYVYEDDPGTSLPNVKSYRMALSRSDIVIVMLELDKEIPEGVGIEIKDATELKKPMLYFFIQGDVDHGKINSSIRKRNELIASGSVKFTEVKSFDRLVETVVSSVLNDIISVYLIHNGSNVLEENTSGIEEKTKGTFPQVYDETGIDEESIPDDTISFLFSLINRGVDAFVGDSQGLSYDSENQKQTPITDLISGLLMLRGFDRDIVSSARNYLGLNQPDEVLDYRFEALSCFNEGRLGDAIECLKKALAESKRLEVPLWIVNSIAIDLRNLIEEKLKIEGEWPGDNYGQEVLNQSNELVWYPFVDRLKLEILEYSSDYYFKSEDRPIGTISFNNHTHELKKLVRIALVAFSNASITHLWSFKNEYIKFLRFLDADQFNPTFVSEAIRVFILSDQENSLKSFFEKSRVYSDHISSEFVQEVLRECEFINVDVLRFRAKLMTMAYLGQLIDDAGFDSIWQDVKAGIPRWKTTKNRFDGVPELLYRVFNQNMFRIASFEIMDVLNQSLSYPDFIRYEYACRVFSDILVWNASLERKNELDDVEKDIRKILQDILRNNGLDNSQWLKSTLIRYLQFARILDDVYDSIRDQAEEIFPGICIAYVFREDVDVRLHERIDYFINDIKSECEQMSMQTGVYSFSNGIELGVLSRLIHDHGNKMERKDALRLLRIAEKVLFDEKIHAEYKYKMLLIVWAYRRHDTLREIVIEFIIDSIIENKDKMVNSVVFSHSFLMVDRSLIELQYYLTLRLFDRKDKSIDILDLMIYKSSAGRANSVHSILGLVHEYLSLLNEDEMHDEFVRSVMGFLLMNAHKGEKEVRIEAIRCLMELIRADYYEEMLEYYIAGMMERNTFEAKQLILCEVDDCLDEDKDEFVNYVFDLADMDNNRRLRQISKLRRALRKTVRPR